jgi:BCD family chlorophyll transporter-like MFS transporter
MLGVITQSKQTTLFFWYLTLLLAAILGQDVLLEPFAAEQFGMSVQETTRITSIWGTAVLATILVAGALERRAPRKLVAQVGNLSALGGFLLILLSGLSQGTGIFYAGVLLLGAGTGLSTVANLALMFDLTLPGYMGLFIGAWGVANSLSRLAGILLAGVLRDAVTALTQDPLLGYRIVFGLEALMLLAAAWMLTSINLQSFQQQVQPLSPVERAAMAD